MSLLQRKYAELVVDMPSFKKAQEHIDLLILSTPTGELRDNLTVANIHLALSKEQWDNMMATLSLAIRMEPK